MDWKTISVTTAVDGTEYTHEATYLTPEDLDDAVAHYNNELFEVITNLIEHRAKQKLSAIVRRNPGKDHTKAIEEAFDKWEPFHKSTSRAKANHGLSKQMLNKLSRLNDTQRKQVLEALK